MVGIVEGEGSFYLNTNRPGEHTASDVMVQVGMSDADTIARLAALLGVPRAEKPDKRKANFSTIYTIRLTGFRAIALIREIEPYMSDRRRQKAAELMTVVPPQVLQQTPLFDFHRYQM